MEKDIEKMREAVLAYCETAFEGKSMWSKFPIGNDAVIFKAIDKYDLCQINFGGKLGRPYLTIQPSMTNFDAFLAYKLLGLSERDAVEAEKARLLKRYKARIKRLRADDAETHRIQMEVKDERIAALEAKNAALVAALESLKREVGYKPRRHGEIVLYRNDLGVFIDNALAANEKGGKGE